MNRDRMIDFLRFSPDIFDIIVIGGGATGLGAAVDSASRGYRTLLLESHDFTKATSSKSTKLIHGGIRYLQQGKINLVKKSLQEREFLYKNAPHLVKSIPFLIPTYGWAENKYYQLGLKFYDRLSKNLSLKKSESVSKEYILQNYPTLDSTKIYGGVVYYDGQFDDSRLGITLAKTCVNSNGVVLNYCPVVGFTKKHGKINGVIAHDVINKEEYRLHAKVVINATGIFSDKIRQLDDESSLKLIQPSQGIHLVFSKEILNCDSAIIIPKTSDGRTIFLIPWHNHVLIGTTDTKVNQVSYEPNAFEIEIEYLLKHASKYLKYNLSKSDIRSVFVGLRPLIKKNNSETSKLSREHLITVSKSNLITITGGKWTLYRKMAQDVVDKAIDIANLKFYPSNTENLKLHGHEEQKTSIDPLDMYGSDKEKIRQMVNDNPELGNTIHPDLPYLFAEVLWACQEEMAETLDDVLARRTRALFLNSRAAIEASSSVIDLIAEEKAKDQKWKDVQLKKFKDIAKNYDVISK